jgi:hypothetical protein
MDAPYTSPVRGQVWRVNTVSETISILATGLSILAGIDVVDKVLCIS